jgi:UDP-N-acetylmuramoyl-L-alanyl-D-glutamate--2,6-diaminopimelate ligase
MGLTLAQGELGASVQELTDDSRQVQPGWLFVARGGTRSDGRAFVPDALARGAVAVISDQAPEQPARDRQGQPVPWLVAPKVDQAFASQLAGRFFGQPSHRLKLVGVTGTKGKTTTTYLIQHLLAAAGARCGMIGTVILDDGATRRPAELTTPGAIDFQRLLAAMVANGCEAAAAEISSHALHQGRVAHLRFAAGVFTNLTGDHLDYHGTMDHYADAKAILFELLDHDAWAVINADDPYAARMRQAFAGDPSRVEWCTLSDDTPLDEGRLCRATVLELGARHSQARFDGPWGSVEVRLPLVGRHNVANTLQAVTAANVVRSLARTLHHSLESAPMVPGRLQAVPPPDDAAATLPAVLVDYAHTHDALEKVLLAVRPITRGKVICLFGCGGDRDRTKRPKMAAVACKLADRVVITSDNPRTEEPGAIIDEILKGVPAGSNGKVSVEPDRAAAIARAIADAAPDDVVLLAGKGHEDYQIIGTQKRHFDDREEAAKALRVRVAGRRTAGAGA